MRQTKHKAASKRPQPVQTRIAAVMMHTKRYAFKGKARLAQDAGISKSAVSRLLNGQSSPSFVLVAKLAQALEKELGFPLEIKEIVSLDGNYPTEFVCSLVKCPGCLPPEVYDHEGYRKPEFKAIQPGQWNTIEVIEAKEQDKEQG